MPNIHINFMAIIVAVVANFILGFIWYTPLFGKAWAKEMNFPPDFKPSTGSFVSGMIVMLLGNFFMAWVLAHNMAAWDPTSWNLPPSSRSDMSNGLMAGIFTWLGFFFPTDIGTVFWENKSWKLFFINTIYHLLAVVLVAIIIATMK